MEKNAFGILVIIIAVAAGVIVYDRRQVKNANVAKDQAELDAGVRASEVLSAVFRQAAALKVATLTGKIRSSGECASGYFIPNRQSTVAPYSVSYTVDLSHLDRSAYRWNAAEHTMYISAPMPTIEPPNIDMSQAKSTQSGAYVSRNCGLAMQRQVAGRLSATASVYARKAKYTAQSQESARATLRNLVRQPLAAAGIGGVQVIVRFPSEPVPSDERWEMSRSIEEVLADPAYH